MAKKFSYVLYLPDISGQVKLWHNIFERQSAASDETYQMGNFLGLNEDARDTSARKGANMELLIAISSRIRSDRWKQLIGPYELAALNFPDEWTNQNSRKILRDLWMNDEGLMKVAYVSSGRLVTHGGLTYGEWVDLGRPQNAAATARKLNEKYMKQLRMGDSYLLTGVPNFSANPVTAHPSRELYPSWITAPEGLPFDQITGGGSLNEPEGRALVGAEESLYKYADSISYPRFGSRLIIKGQNILSLGLALSETPMTKLSEDRVLYVEKQEVSTSTIQKPF